MKFLGSGVIRLPFLVSLILYTRRGSPLNFELLLFFMGLLASEGVSCT